MNSFQQGFLSCNGQSKQAQASEELEDPGAHRPSRAHKAERAFEFLLTGGETEDQIPALANSRIQDLELPTNLTFPPLPMLPLLPLSFHEASSNTCLLCPLSSFSTQEDSVFCKT